MTENCWRGRKQWHFSLFFEANAVVGVLANNILSIAYFNILFRSIINAKSKKSNNSKVELNATNVHTQKRSKQIYFH
jgi:hypothetical protein